MALATPAVCRCTACAGLAACRRAAFAMADQTDFRRGTMGSDKKLYKTEDDRIICGVCGGIARYFNLDPTLVRLAFAFLSIVGGSGVLLYLAAAVIIPRQPR